MSSMVKNFVFFLAGLLVIAGALSFVDLGKTPIPEVSIAKLVEQVNQDQVGAIEVQGDTLHVTLRDEKKETVRKESGESVSELMKNYGVAPERLSGVNLTIKKEGGFSYYLGALLPVLIPFILIGIVVFFMMRQVQGANSKAMTFGQSGAKEVDSKGKNKVTFADIAGSKEAKEELSEIVEFLKNPKRFTQLGAKIPKGVLLMGPPGTGKTLLARAVAGEADAPFFHISGSEFVEMFVGVGASRVRDLFRKAKRAAPCIIFIDEIDAVGRQRGSGLGGSHDEREQTLNQILVEMDGFDPNIGVIVIAATNRPDVLDPALLRPGRFDRRVILDNPDINDREAILKIHAQGKPLEKDMNLRRVAERTPGFSGADLANLLNEAAILTARRDKKIIGTDEVLESIEKVLLGPERRSHILSDAERKVTAYHEAGHALVAATLPLADPVRKVSIISRGRAAGYTLKLPFEDRYMRGHAYFLTELAVGLGGYVAEKMIFNDLSTGPSNDLRVITDLAKKMITEYGMSTQLGPRTFGEQEEMMFMGRGMGQQRDYSEKVAEQIDAEVNRLVTEARATAEKVLTDKRQLLDKIAATLLEKETLEQDAFDAIIKGELPSQAEKDSSTSVGVKKTAKA